MSCQRRPIVGRCAAVDPRCCRRHDKQTTCWLLSRSRSLAACKPAFPTNWFEPCSRCSILISHRHPDRLHRPIIIVYCPAAAALQLLQPVHLSVSLLSVYTSVAVFSEFSVQEYVERWRYCKRKLLCSSCKLHLCRPILVIFIERKIILALWMLCKSLIHYCSRKSL